MEKKQRAIFRKLSEISAMIASNISEENIDDVNSSIEKLELVLKNIFKKTKPKAPPIWRSFANMTEEEIRKEFADTEKYPDLDSIKSAVKGFLEMRKVSKVKTRETLIEHIIETYRKRQHIGELGR